MHSAAEVACAANLDSSGASADQPVPQQNTDVKQARIRVKNCRAQKKYRQKKQVHAHFLPHLGLFVLYRAGNPDRRLFPGQVEHLKPS